MPQHYDYVLSLLNRKYSSVERVFGRTLFKLAREAYVYLRFSSGTGDEKRKYFFGLDEETIERVKPFDFAVLFVCGDSEDFFVINKPDLLNILHNVEIKGGQWKVYINNDDHSWQLKVTGKDPVNISHLKDGVDRLFLSTDLLPFHEMAEDKLDPDEQPVRDTIPASETEDLMSRLRSESKNSSEPKMFEEAVMDGFRYFGFECEHIGGAGNTDVLITQPYRVILEAKATTRNQIDKIYFTRLKQHMAKHQANHIAVIADKFAPSVIRDAEIESTLLIPVDDLCRILEMSEKYPISTGNLSYIFNDSGLLSKQTVSYLEEQISSFVGKIGHITVVANSIDEVPRSVDEIYGRYQINAQSLTSPMLTKEEFEVILNFASLPFIDLAVNNGELFSRTTSNSISTRRISKLGELLQKEEVGDTDK